MNIYRRLSIILFVLAAAFSGCETGETCDIVSSAIRVNYEVIDQGSGQTARAQFMYKGTSLELGDCGDSIKVNGETLERVSGEYPVTYSADVEPDDDGEFEFVFDRSGDGPFSSVTTVPPSFNIDTPSEGSRLSRKDGFEIEWTDGSDYDMHFQIEGDCVWDYSESTSDEGYFFIEPDEIEATVNDEDESCDAHLVMFRRMFGEVDPVFDEGSSIEGRSQDSLNFKSIP